MTLLAALAGLLGAIGVVDLIAGSRRWRDRRPPAADAAGRFGRSDGGAAAAQGASAARPPGDQGASRSRDWGAGEGAGGGRTPGVQAASGSRTAIARGAMRLIAAVGRRFPARAPAGLGRRLDAAGVDAGIAEVMALKAGAAVAALAFALLVTPGATSGAAWVVPLGAPLLGFLAPDAWLRRRTVRRRDAMERQLGDVLELLRVAVEAGLTVPRALGEVGRRHPGVLAVEIRHVAGLMELGVTQRQALDVLVRRCPAPGVGALTAALSRAERHGAPLGDALAAQAEEARARRARAAIEAAARAAPKIQLIVALLLVPSAMLLMAAAMLPALAWR